MTHYLRTGAAIAKVAVGMALIGGIYANAPKNERGNLKRPEDLISVLEAEVIEENKISSNSVPKITQQTRQVAYTNGQVQCTGYISHEGRKIYTYSNGLVTNAPPEVILGVKFFSRL